MFAWQVQQLARSCVRVCMASYRQGRRCCLCLRIDRHFFLLDSSCFHGNANSQFSGDFGAIFLRISSLVGSFDRFFTASVSKAASSCFHGKALARQELLSAFPRRAIVSQAVMSCFKATEIFFIVGRFMFPRRCQQIASSLRPCFHGKLTKIDFQAICRRFSSVFQAISKRFSGVSYAIFRRFLSDFQALSLGKLPGIVSRINLSQNYRYFTIQPENYQQGLTLRLYLEYCF